MPSPARDTPPFRTVTGFTRVLLRLLVVEDGASGNVGIEAQLRDDGFDIDVRRVALAGGRGEPPADRDCVVCESVTAVAAVMAGPLRKLPMIAVCRTLAEAAEAKAFGARDCVPRHDLRRLGIVIAQAVADARIEEEREAKQDELAERDRRYRALLDHAADGILIWHDDGRVLDVNPMFCEVSGYDREACLRLDVAELFDESDLEREPIGRNDLRAGRRRLKSRRLVRRDGSKIAVEFSSRQIAPSTYLSIMRDMSEREANERAMRYQLSLLASTLDATTEGIIATDRDQRVVVWNRRAVEITRVDEKVFQAGAAWPLFEQIAAGIGDPELFLSLSAQAVELSRIKLSGVMQTADGRMIEYTRCPQILSGEIVGRVWRFMDVTARKHAVDALLASEEKFRSLVENIPEVALTIDASGSVSFVSANCQSVTGWTAEEMLAMSPAERSAAVHPDDLPAIRRAFTALFEEGISYDIEYRRRHRDGRWMWCHARASRTYERDGVRRADMVISDITARMEAASAQRELAAVLENAVEGIARLDRDGMYEQANAAFAAIVGRTAGQLAGSHWRTDIHPDDRSRFAEALRKIHEEPNTEMEVRAVSTDGSAREIRVLLLPSFDQEGRPAGHYCFAKDITEQKRLEARLDQANRVGSLGRVAATVAHEFNNVLMGIQPFTERIARRVTDAQLAEAAGRIMTSVKRGKRITEEILRFTRPVAPSLTARDLTQWLAHLEPELREIAGSKCVVRVARPGGSTVAHCDKAQIEQVVTNLVTNARDAMPDGGTITVTLAGGESLSGGPVSAKEQPFVRITVRDEGSGVPPELLEQIFEPLFTTKRGGTGLGLAVARQVAVQHGGFIVAENQAGGGTAFHLFLPEGDPATHAEDSPPPNRAYES